MVSILLLNSHGKLVKPVCRSWIFRYRLMIMRSQLPFLISLPTHACSYLLFSSSHPNHTKQSIPDSQFLRLVLTFHPRQRLIFKIGTIRPHGIDERFSFIWFSSRGYLFTEPRIRARIRARIRLFGFSEIFFFEKQLDLINKLFIIVANLTKL